MTFSPEKFESLPFGSPYVRKYLARVNKAGRVAAYTDAILIVLAARDLDVTDALCERIARYTSLKQLATWVRRAATVEKASDIFGNSADPGNRPRALPRRPVQQNLGGDQGDKRSC